MKLREARAGIPKSQADDRAGALAPREHDVSVLMLADGQEAEVEQVAGEFGG